MKIRKQLVLIQLGPKLEIVKKPAVSPLKATICSVEREVVVGPASMFPASDMKALCLQ